MTHLHQVAVRRVTEQLIKKKRVQELLVKIEAL